MTDFIAILAIILVFLIRLLFMNRQAVEKTAGPVYSAI